MAAKLPVWISISKSSRTISMTNPSTATSMRSPGRAYHCFRDAWSGFSFSRPILVMSMPWVVSPAFPPDRSQGFPETFLKAPAESSAQPQSFAGLQDDLVVAFRVELEGANPVEVHDDGAMDADESRSAQIDLELRQGPAKEVRGAAHVETGVVAGGLDPVDVRDIDEE